MSTKAREWAWKNQLSPNRLIVLLALAENADDLGICWPSVGYLSRRTHLSHRTVQRIVKELEKLHLLTKKVRAGDFGRQTSNQYRLCLPCKSQEIQEERVILSPFPSSVIVSLPKPCHREGDSYVTLGGAITVSPLKPKQELSLKTKQEPSEKNSSHNSYATQVSHAEVQKIKCLLSQFDKKESDSLLSLLSHAHSSGLIRSSPSRWLKGVIRKRAQNGKYDD